MHTHTHIHTHITHTHTHCTQLILALKRAVSHLLAPWYVGFAVEQPEQTHPKQYARVAVAGCTARSAVARKRPHVAGGASFSVLRCSCSYVDEEKFRTDLARTLAPRFFPPSLPLPPLPFSSLSSLLAFPTRPRRRARRKFTELHDDNWTTSREVYPGERQNLTYSCLSL